MSINSAEEISAEVKGIALSSGADLVGIVSASTIDCLPRIWVGWTIQEYNKMTTEIMPDSRSLVVLGTHVWDDMLELAVRKGEDWVYPGYFPLDVPRQAVIRHLEKKGYKAVSFGRVSHKRLAQLAGLGNYGKNALIINPTYGPWTRFSVVLTNAEMRVDTPFDHDLCGDCEECIKACPVGALTPYRVDDTKCLVGIHIAGDEISQYEEELQKYEPSFTRNSHLMCVECQKACKYGREGR
jgi:ferredoxin